jgi:hypothetical protein
VAAKATIDRLGINLIENEENAGAAPVPAQPLQQPRRIFVPALPLKGYLRPEALLPVVVQPQLIPRATYTAPHSGVARSCSNPVQGLTLRGREGP